jgi:radical SAM protein with 4Fe4S-binding SPASM domain
MLRPISLEWDLAYNCNLKCLHCRNDVNTEYKFFNIDYYKRLIERVAPIKAEFLTIGGGEPFLYPHLFEIIKFGNSLGFKCRILSNGWFIDEEIAEKLKKSDVWGVMVSIDGIGRNHDKIRGMKGCFKRAVEAIKVLKDYEINVVVGMTINSLNYKQVSKVAKLCYKLGVKNLGARPVIPVGRGGKNEFLDLDASQYKEIMTEIYGLRIKYKDKVKIRSGDPLFNTVDESKRVFVEKNIKVIGGCDIGIATLRVDPYGNITPCPALSNIVLGNVFLRDIKEIWLKNSTLNLLRTKENLMGKCGACKFKYVCGGCRARALQEGNILGSDPKCWWTISQREEWEKN